MQIEAKRINQDLKKSVGFSIQLQPPRSHSLFCTALAEKISELSAVKIARLASYFESGVLKHTTNECALATTWQESSCFGQLESGTVFHSGLSLPHLNCRAAWEPLSAACQAHHCWILPGHLFSHDASVFISRSLALSVSLRCFFQVLSYTYWFGLDCVDFFG